MAYTALYRAFRPKTFSEVVGQEHIKTTLKNQIKLGRVGHAYLLNGTRGTGKTSIAKILARAVNCENPKDGEPCNECEICKAIIDGSLTDVVEMDAASNNSVEDIREIRNEVNFLPTRAKYRVYIIDEVHMLSTGAFNALLKTLEEPPEHVKFILATTEPQKIPATILSRCQRFDFKKLSNENIVTRLKYVCEVSNVKAENDALNLIAILSEGAMRDALSILERCIQDGEDNINIDKIKDLVGIPKLTYVQNIVEAIIEKNIEKAINEIDIVIEDGKDLTNFLWEMIKYVKDILLYKIGKTLEIYNNEEIKDLNKLAEESSKESLLKMIYKLSEMENRLKQSTQKIIIFQTEIIKLCINGEENGLEERVKLLEDKMKNGITVMNTTISKEKKDSYETNNLMMQNNVENGKEKKVQVNTNVSKEKDIISTRNMQTANLKSQDFWPNILQQLKANGKLMIYANLLNSRAVEINDMTIGIEFSGGLNEFRKKLLEKNENISEIQKLVSIACGKEMQIKYIDKPVGEIIQTQTKKIEEKKFSSNRKMQSENDIINSLDALENLGLPIDYIDE
jgi:DNA polymerase-3 subunit gamma/tau